MTQPCVPIVFGIANLLAMRQALYPQGNKGELNVDHDIVKFNEVNRTSEVQLEQMFEVYKAENARWLPAVPANA